MKINDWLLKIYRFFFQSEKKEPPVAMGNSPRDSKEPPLHFKSMIIVSGTPNNDSIGDKEFVAVIHENTPFWALFRCPCGCGNVISLSLQKIHKPNWTVTRTKDGRPTLYPSVWQNKGCCSHFWIKDGRVLWCKD